MTSRTILEPRDWDARYGRGLVSRHAPEYDSCVVVTSPSAWAVVERFFSRPPLLVEFNRGMQGDYLDDLIRRLPEAKLVVGVGGGNALDVAKVAAWKKGLPLVKIPTIVSTGAMFQPNVAIRRPDTWDFQLAASPEYLLFDTDVIRAAPPRLNCAGMGECICHLSVVGGWRWWSRQGFEGPAWQAEHAQITIDWVEQRVAQFVGDLDSQGQPAAEGIRVAAEINRQRYDLPAFHRASQRGLDHVFCIGFEWVHGRELRHSEAVALGTLISNYLHDWRFEEAKDLLERCRVRFRPEQIGCSRAEIRRTLERITELPDRLGWARNWCHHHRVDDATFERMMAAIEAESGGVGPRGSARRRNARAASRDGRRHGIGAPIQFGSRAGSEQGT